MQKNTTETMTIYKWIIGALLGVNGYFIKQMADEFLGIKQEINNINKHITLEEAHYITIKETLHEHSDWIKKTDANIAAFYKEYGSALTKLSAIKPKETKIESDEN